MHVTLAVNRDRIELDVVPSRTLADVLRKDCGLAGTEIACTDGTCGACTVLVEGEAIRACLMLAVQSDGAHVRTVEGLARDHPLRTLGEGNTDGCGHCLAGLVMLAVGAIEHDPGIAADQERLRRLLAANRCRCPGHEAQQQAVIRAADPRAGGQAVNPS